MIDACSLCGEKNPKTCDDRLWLGMHEEFDCPVIKKGREDRVRRIEEDRMLRNLGGQL